MFLFNLDNRDKNTKNYQLKVKDIYLAYNSFVNAPTCTHMGGKNFDLARLDWSRRKGCYERMLPGDQVDRAFHSCLRIGPRLFKVFCI